jgi:hypothetical protein
LPEPGNISSVVEWVMTDLPNGDYQYRLRSVDAAYIGSITAVGEFSVGVVSNDEQSNNLPEEYSIKQNYPNPFNPATAIEYSMPEEGFVTMKVYNAIGKEVTTLVNEVKQPGNYKLTFDASLLPSGVYFYRIKAGNFFQKKMILMKSKN